MRTYSRDEWTSARDAWSDFSEEWTPFRDLAASHGMLFPPAGDKFDSWEDDHPSQRAILIRAIRETPELLRQCIGRSTSWTQVIGNLTGERDAWRRRNDEGRQPDQKRSVVSLSQILAAAHSHRVAQLEAVADAARHLSELHAMGAGGDDWWGAHDALAAAVAKLDEVPS